MSSEPQVVGSIALRSAELGTRQTADLAATSSALEYVKKLVLVFVEELPGFEFFVQDSRV